MDAASIQRSLSSRREQHKLGNSSPNVSVKSAECKAGSTSAGHSGARLEAKKKREEQKEEEQRRRAASCQMGQPAPATRNADFLSGSGFSFFKGTKECK